MIEFIVRSVHYVTELFAKGRPVFWGLVFTLTSLMFFIIFHSEKDYKKELSLSRGNSYMEGVRIVNKKGGVDSWVILARKADFSRDETTVQMSSVTIDVKKEGAVLNADGGTYNMNTQGLRLEKNIVIHMKDSTISTDSLAWNPAGRLISSDGKVQMQGNKFRIEGEGLTATEDDKVRLTRNVKAIFF